MSSLLKSLVERIVHDTAFREAFLAKPEVVLEAEPLSVAERRALIRARRRLVPPGAGGLGRGGDLRPI